jgi:hypothetical protein
MQKEILAPKNIEDNIVRFLPSATILGGLGGFWLYG